jgi:uncharacterized protein YyaL (SSP411 family)
VSLPLRGEYASVAGPDRIQWRHWDSAAFAQAQAEGKPVLLSIGAVWCHWCHVMDQTSYVDPQVVRLVNGSFIAIRADTEHRPDINARYNVGGWPTTAFLTAHGGFIGGATYLPADQLLAMLMEVRRAYQEHRPQIYDKAQEQQRQRQERVARVASGPAVTAALVDRIARRVAGAYDAVNGGFGEAPKFPAAPVLQLLLHRFRTTGEAFYRVMLEKTLDRMSRSAICDQVEGGFFRHCAGADWSEPQLEKLLEDNLGLARVYLDAALLLGQEDYRRTADRIMEFLLGHLRDQDLPGFRGSQGAHSDYFGLSLAARRGLPAPAVDPFSYTHWNTQAVSLLLEASWKLPRPDLALLALDLLESVDAVARRGRLNHVRPLPKSGPGPELLADSAGLLNALMDAYYHTAQGKYLERAKNVASGMLDRFADAERGGFFDVARDSEAVGYLRVREKPLPENAAAVQGLLKLHHADPEPRYREAAQRALSAFVETYGEYGEFAAGYAVAVEVFLESPVEVTVEGRLQDPSTWAMLQAAARLPSPHLVTRLVAPARSGEPARAHVCLDTVCLPPVGDPASLAPLVAGMATQQASPSPFENILERFPGL